jgi:hypothetical protein
MPKNDYLDPIVHLSVPVARRAFNEDINTIIIVYKLFNASRNAELVELRFNKLAINCSGYRL